MLWSNRSFNFSNCPKGYCRAEISDGDMQRFNNDDIPTHLKISWLRGTPVLVKRQRETHKQWLDYMTCCSGKKTGCIRFGDSCCIHCQHAVCIFQDMLGLKPMVKRDLIIIGVCRACPCQFTVSCHLVTCFWKILIGQLTLVDRSIKSH